LSTVEPRNFEKASIDKHWIKAMEEELNQIEKNKTWELVPRPKYKHVFGQVTKKKERLLCKGYAQIERVDFEEKFVDVSKMEEI
jgi:hypothetical protein